MMDLKGQLQQAELDFVRKCGQLKYLKHLKKNQTVENCPICDTSPETKVSSPQKKKHKFIIHSELK